MEHRKDPHKYDRMIVISSLVAADVALYGLSKQPAFSEATLNFGSLEFSYAEATGFFLALTTLAAVYLYWKKS